MVSKSSNFKEKALAEESEKTKKVREKLKKRFQTLETHLTEQALQQKVEEIHGWISRHADQRTPLKNKSIALFDENRNAAQISEKVMKIALKFQIENREEPLSHESEDV